MEAWRLIAAALIAAGGVVLVLFVMARARERGGSTTGQVALAGAITFTVLSVLCVLVVTVLAPWLTWSLVILVGLTVTVMLVAD
jgi:hypothetical protein